MPFGLQMFGRGGFCVKRRVLLYRGLGSGTSAFEDLTLAPRVGTNYLPLSPVSLIKHAANVYTDHLCYVSGAGVVAKGDEVKRTWGQVHERVKRVAARLRSDYGVKRNDVVSVISPNTHPIFELHYAVPGCRAVLHTINTRLDPKTIAFQLQHAETKVLFVDTEFSALVQQSLDLFPPNAKRPVIVDLVDTTAASNAWPWCGGGVEYEDLAAGASSSSPPPLQLPEDEWDAIALNYTSGTTGSPKGVVTHHRGAYLNALQNLVETTLPRHAKKLWVVPLFHCNGWSYVWSMAANAGSSFFLRSVRAPVLFRILDEHKIQHFCGAPITMLTMLQHAEKEQSEGRKREPYTHDVSLITAGAPPPPDLIKKFSASLGISVQTAYGLTESYGPISSGSKSAEQGQEGESPIWQRKGSMLEDMDVVDPTTGLSVPHDGETRGEIVLRGNILMRGYFKNPAATEAEFRNGWYFTGDVGVVHRGATSKSTGQQGAVAQGGQRVEIKDRSKDIIISGGENVNSIEVETALLQHPLVQEAAVVAKADAKWGEVPWAFVVLSSHGKAPPTEQELIAWSRSKLAGFASPKGVVVVAELPKTSTGKVLKHILRDSLKEGKK